MNIILALRIKELFFSCIEIMERSDWFKRIQKRKKNSTLAAHRHIREESKYATKAFRFHLINLWAPQIFWVLLFHVLRFSFMLSVDYQLHKSKQDKWFHAHLLSALTFEILLSSNWFKRILNKRVSKEGISINWSCSIDDMLLRAVLKMELPNDRLLSL